PYTVKRSSPEEINSLPEFLICLMDTSDLTTGAKARLRLFQRGPSREDEKSGLLLIRSHFASGPEDHEQDRCEHGQLEQTQYENVGDFGAERVRTPIIWKWRAKPEFEKLARKRPEQFNSSGLRE